ncbi:MAG: hypothetical protein Q4G65_14615 [bacterium]|nr:hypothetical protein [bacterium]
MSFNKNVAWGRRAWLFTAVNAGQELALETVVEGDTVSVRTRSTGGMTLFIR